MGDDERFSDLKNQIASLQDWVVQSALNSSKHKVLEPKSFWWDAFILFIATTISGLSITDVLVEFLRPDSSKVACFVHNESFNRDQVQYVNEFCHQDLPFSVNFTIYLFLQGLLLIVPHFAWKVIVRARIDSFYSHVTKMETLRDRRTGKYPDKNYYIVENMQKQFGGKKCLMSLIAFFYLIKLIVQSLFIVIFSVITFAAFIHLKDSDITFNCGDNGPDPLFRNIKCSYSKFQYLFFLWIGDIILLLLSILVMILGFVFVLKNDANLGHCDVSKFSYQSGIDSEFYVAKSWKFKLLLIYDDLNILLSMLSSTDAGVAQMYKSVQIESDMSHEFNSNLELSVSRAAEIAKGEGQNCSKYFSSFFVCVIRWKATYMLFLMNIAL